MLRGLRIPWREPITQASRVRDLKSGKLKARKKNDPERRDSILQ